MKPMLTAPGTKRLKLRYDGPLSNFAFNFILRHYTKMNISCTVIDPSDLGALEKALSEHECSLYFTESPTNPYLRCVVGRRRLTPY